MDLKMIKKVEIEIERLEKLIKKNTIIYDNLKKKYENNTATYEEHNKFVRANNSIVRNKRKLYEKTLLLNWFKEGGMNSLNSVII